MATLGLILLFVVTVVISALVGLIRGMSKSVIRIITLALAAVLTFVVAAPVTTTIAQGLKFEGLTLGQMLLEGLRSTDMVGGILDSAPLMQEAILVAPAFVLSLLVFPLVFILLSFVSWILFLIIQKPLRKLIFREDCGKEASTGVRIGKRFAGLGIGIVTGVLIFGMLLAPMFGLFSILPQQNTIDEVLDVMADQNLMTNAEAEIIREAYTVTDNGLVNFYGQVGITAAGKAYINSVSKIEADDQRIYLANEINSLLAVAQTAMEGGLIDALMASDSQTALYALLADKAFMDALMQDMFQSRLLCAAVPEVMAIAMEGVATSMSVPANKTVVYQNMMNDVALAVKNAEIDYAAIQAYEQAHNVTYTFARTAMPMRIRTSAAVMTEEEYLAEIQKLAELTKTISNILNRAISGDNATFTDSVANQIVSQVKAQASENGQGVIDNFDSASVQDAISSINAADVDAGEGNAEELLGQLSDQDKFETDVATVETIKESIYETVKNAMADEEKAAETASTLASVVSDLAGAVSSATDEDGNLNATDLDFDKIASAVTSLQNSSLKGVGSSVLDIVASSDLGSNTLISDALEVVKDGYENGEDIGGTIGTAGALISLGAAMNGDGEADPEAMTNSLTSLINNLNDYTIQQLPSIMTTENITSMGVPAEYAQSTYTVVETLLKELMKLKGAENYDNEVNSILSLYNLATSGTTQFTADDVADLASYAIESDAIFNTLMSISTSNPFGIEITDEATRENLVNGIEDYYAQSGQTQREWDIYHAVAKLLGLEEEVELGS